MLLVVLFSFVLTIVVILLSLFHVKCIQLCLVLHMEAPAKIRPSADTLAIQSESANP